MLIVHGWPGTFYEFHKIIEPLTNPPPGEPAFHVIIPSVPGFGFSSTPRKQGWTVKDTARIFNRLVVDVLGYKSYAAQGGDWVSLPPRSPTSFQIIVITGVDHIYSIIRVSSLQSRAFKYVYCASSLLAHFRRSCLCSP